MTTSDAALVLDEIALLLQLRGESEFRAKAYSAAAHAVRESAADLVELVATNRLTTIRGLGASIQNQLTTLVSTGTLPYLDELRASVPPGLLAMVRVPGLGPRKALALHAALEPASLAELETMAADGRVAQVKGFGAKSAENILAAVRYLRSAGDRLRFSTARALALPILDAVRAVPGVVRAELAGELRRCDDVVGDAVFVAAADDPDRVLQAVADLASITRILERTPHSVRAIAATPFRTRTLTLPVELKCVAPAKFPMAWLEATGPTEHVAELKSRAVERGLNWDAGFDSEEDFYEAVDLAWLPPELRDWPDAVAVAESRSIPDLVQPADIRGIFHNHTTASDGTATLAEMATAAAERGYRYFGVGDHSQSLIIANGLTPERVRAQWHEARAFNDSGPRCAIIRGTECDILAQGVLDFDDATLAGFDYVVATVHTLFGLSEAEQTERVCQALAHPAVTMLGHPTGRLLLRRDGYKINLEAVIDAAARHGKMIEINAQPDRLDLSAGYCRLAKARGVPLVINPDAHAIADLDKVEFGVNVARRAGLSRADVFNTQDRDEVIAELSRRRPQ